MTISSRTPEGRRNHCPICAADVCIEPSMPVGDAPCPKCGHLLWFVDGEHGPCFFDAEKLARQLAERLGVAKEQITLSTSFFDDVGVDSLDMVEVMMDLEEEFDITITEDEVADIRTVGDAMRLIERRMHGE